MKPGKVGQNVQIVDPKVEIPKPPEPSFAVSTGGTSYTNEKGFSCDSDVMKRVSTWLAINPDTFPQSGVEAGKKLAAAIEAGSISRGDAICLLYRLCQRDEDFTSLGGSEKMGAKWTQHDFVGFIEVLVEHDVPVYNDPMFRKLLNRDQNLYINQNVREATTNVAYRSVDFDIDDVDDNEFWSRVDKTGYNELIEDNAAQAILKMAERFNLIN